jgi:hypothetical protein
MKEFIISILLTSIIIFIGLPLFIWLISSKKLTLENLIKIYKILFK